VNKRVRIRNKKKETLKNFPNLSYILEKTLDKG